MQIMNVLYISFFENLGPFRVYFGSIRVLLEFARDLFLWFTVRKEVWIRPVFFLTILSYATPAPWTMYIPNSHVVSAFKNLLLIGVSFLCPLWVYLSFNSLGLFWVCSSKPRITFKQTRELTLGLVEVCFLIDWVRYCN